MGPAVMVRMRSVSAIKSRRFRLPMCGDLGFRSGELLSGMAFRSDKWRSSLVHFVIAAPEKECEVTGIGFPSTTKIDDRPESHLAMAAGGGEG